MSPKSIVRVVRRALTAARAPRADETDFLGIAIPSPERVRDHQHSTVRCSIQPQTAGFEPGVCEVRAIQRDGIQEDGHGRFERHAVLGRVGIRLPWIPVEHAFSIYTT